MASRNKPPPTSNVNRRSQPPALASRSTTPTTTAASAAPATPERPSGIARRNTIREGTHSRSGSSISSPLSARAAAKGSRPVSTNDDELENAAILEDLRSRLAKSESAAEAAVVEYAKQIKALQSRLQESISEQTKMEETNHQREEIIERLEVQIKDLTRTKREQENIYEAERIATQQEKEELLNREEELNTIIQRLKGTLSARDSRSPVNGRRDSADSTPMEDSMGFAPAAHSPVPSQNSLVLQKDKLIESLRLELAEAQIHLAEADQMEGSKLNQLESQLLEARMTNARLMEDNESFQLMLSSAALNGDFPRGDYLSTAFSDTDVSVELEGADSRRGSVGLGLNLAAELDEADVKEDNEKVRKLEGELKQLKEQNKGMSLYINNIIERILQHKDSEAILDKTSPSFGASAASATTTAAPAPVEKEKSLPPTPNPSDEGVNILGLQRTKSLATRRGHEQNLQRSQSLASRRENGGHKRTQSDQHISGINNIYRSEGFITPRGQNTSFFGNGERSSRPRDSSASVDSGVSDTNTTNTSESTGDRYSFSSPPPSHIGPIAGNKLRPLTLVQKNVSNGMMSPPLGGRRISGDYMDGDGDPRLERRSSKRSSWMGNWFNRDKNENGMMSPQDVVFEGKDVE